MKLQKILIYATVSFIFSSCGDHKEQTAEGKFEYKAADQSGIYFTNQQQESMFWNYLVYPYIYLGGGVAAGDINNDGLPDLYFTGNMVPNELYLNQGNFKFKEITIDANVRGDDRWMTGVTMADVNDDGFLDIYVSVSGKEDESIQRKKNLLFINNQDLTFTEMAADYGLDDPGRSIHSTFFDYDQDGDLDLYVINFPHAFNKTNQYYFEKSKNPEWLDSDHLYRNEGGFFTDVTDEAGIRNFGLGLGISASDFNNDGLVDIYVSNDFNTPDFMYMNNGNGTFREVVKESTKHTANFGMGIDAADFNNDGWIDLIQLDMMAEDNRRKKTNMSGMDPQRFWSTVDLGFHYQYMQNMLQMNNGVMQNGNVIFSEISQLADISETDWSWAPLIADFDNDGWKDIFITNGIPRDVNDNDFRKKWEQMLTTIRNPMEIWTELRKMPSEKISNYAYRNNGDLTFSKIQEEWNLDFKGFTNGAAYADLDQDGDLDLVINNLDTVAMVYENKVGEAGNHLQIKLEGPQGNRFGVGARAKISYPGEDGKMINQWQELSLSRGFQSSVEPVMHFGVKTAELVNVEVFWPGGSKQQINKVPVNQVLNVKYSEADAKTIRNSFPSQSFEEVTEEYQVDFVHQENEYNDFEKEILLPHKMSTFGPALAVGDIDGNGLDDFYIGGAAGQAGKLFVQSNHAFEPMAGPWEQDYQQEDLGAHFFDFDLDGDLDLYVASGGNEFPEESSLLIDRLYENQGDRFIKTKGIIPTLYSSSDVITSADYDNDGDHDLFIGGRLVPQKYPYPPQSHLLENKGGTFEDVTAIKAPELAKAGMVTSALWTDFDNDGQLDLMVAGEWMPVRFFRNTGDAFKDMTAEYQLEDQTGWWFSLAQGDFDQDGDMDYVAGNLGLNYKYKASFEAPFQIFADDFDQTGSIDIVLGYYNEGTTYPVRGRQCSSDQMPFIKEKFPDYNSFADATLQEIYGERSLETSLNYKVNTFATTLIINNGSGDFTYRPLSNEVQISAINQILVKDVDGDGISDLIMAGNLFNAEVETPRSDAGIGMYLKGTGKGEFNPVPYRDSGLLMPHDVKEFALLQTSNGPVLVVANNNGKIQLISIAQNDLKMAVN